MRKIIAFIVIAQLVVSCSAGKTVTKFDRIIFHTTKCFGTCPEYHLELNNNKEVKLFVEKEYQKRELNPERIGYYRGQLDQKKYDEFLSLLEKINLKKSGMYRPLKENEIPLSDGPKLKMILYSNDTRKPIEAIYPIELWEKMITFVYQTGKEPGFVKVDEKLEIESFK